MTGPECRSRAKTKSGETGKGEERERERHERKKKGRNRPTIPHPLLLDPLSHSKEEHRLPDFQERNPLSLSQTQSLSQPQRDRRIERASERLGKKETVSERVRRRKKEERRKEKNPAQGSRGREREGEGIVCIQGKKRRQQAREEKRREEAKNSGTDA